MQPISMRSTRGRLPENDKGIDKDKVKGVGAASMPASKGKPSAKAKDVEIPLPPRDDTNVVRPPGSDPLVALQKYKNRPELTHCKKRVIIPYVLPMENRACNQSQKGMGGFGGARNAVARVDQGIKPLPDDKATEGVLTKFAETNKFASQSGMSAFGAYRDNVTTSTGGKEIDPEFQRLSNLVIPKQAGTNQLPSLAGQTPIGAKRDQVPHVKYQEGMDERLDPEGETFLRRQLAPNPNSHAGTNYLDTFRAQTQEVRYNPPKKDKKSEAILPRLFDPRLSPGSDATGAGAGTIGLRPPRQVTMKIKDSDPLTLEDVIESHKVVPWAMQARLTSQAGMGGFDKRRDVVIFPPKPKRKY